MSKIKTSFSLSKEAIALLKELAKKHNRSQANMLETLIQEQCKIDKIKYS